MALRVASSRCDSVLLASGNVTPSALILIWPVPSALIVLPAKLIVSPLRNISFHLKLALPRLKVSVALGSISPTTTNLPVPLGTILIF